MSSNRLANQQPAHGDVPKRHNPRVVARRVPALTVETFEFLMTRTISTAVFGFTTFQISNTGFPITETAAN